MMKALHQEPIIAVGLIEDVPDVSFELQGEFRLENLVLNSGSYRACAAGDHLSLLSSAGHEIFTSPALHIIAAAPQTACFTLHEVKIGKQFHWERAFSPDVQR